MCLITHDICPRLQHSYPVGKMCVPAKLAVFGKKAEALGRVDVVTAAANLVQDEAKKTLFSLFGQIVSDLSSKL